MNENSIKLLELLKRQRLYFDGAMGTLLIKSGKLGTEAPEYLNLTAPEVITDIHRQYFTAGSNIVCANTFGVNRDKFDDYEKLIEAALNCAKTAREEVFGDTSGNPSCGAFIAFDLGSSGRLLKPIGDLDFDDAVALFAANVKAAVKYGADLIIIETMTDLKETEAALKACHENSDLPIFVTNAYSENSRLMTGASPKDMVKLAVKYGASAVGANCSFGPDKLVDVVSELLKYSPIPVILNPNAGLPEIRDGVTVYNITPDIFADYMKKAAIDGVGILGGCCGTTPEYIEKTVQVTRDIPYVYPSEKELDLTDDDKAKPSRQDNTKDDNTKGDNPHFAPLRDAVVFGEDEDAKKEAEKLLDVIDPITIINDVLIPALNSVGAEFAAGELFLPELMMSAEAASSAFEVLKSKLPPSDGENKRSIIVATVKGDVHDIGKNIVKVLLESYGINVFDLGIDVPVETILSKVEETGCTLVGLSALMTTTVPSMEETVREIKALRPDVTVIVGGAVLTKESADNMGADFYSADAMATVNHTVDYYR